MGFSRSVNIGVLLLISLTSFHCGKLANESMVMDLDLQECFAFENFDGYMPIIYLFVHCSGSNSKSKLRGPDIMKVAKQRGFQRPPYHYFLPRTGEIDTLCKINDDPIISPNELCWGVAGINSRSIHICIEGCFVDYPASKIDSRVLAQKANLLKLIHKYKRQIPGLIVLGHRDYPGVRKACPGFDAKSEYSYIQ
jgi:N-acetylmuramoyl-L-alanine amidase